MRCLCEKGGEIGVLWPQAKEASDHWRLEEALNGFSLRAFAGGMTLAVDLWAPELWKNKFPLL